MSASLTTAHRQSWIKLMSLNQEARSASFGLVLGALICITFISISVSARSEPTAARMSTWQRLPTASYRLNNKQDALAFVGPDLGWYGNGTGRVYRTSDAGSHWHQVWRKSGTYVRALEFADESLGFLGNIGPGYFPKVRDRTPIYITRDGGKTWSPPTSIEGPPVAGICAIDLLKVNGKLVAIRAGGRVGGPAALLESFDSGETWRSRDMSSVTGMILDIHFLDEMVGFIAGASEADESKAHARILKTTDGGKTWHAVFDSSRSGDNNWKLAFPSAKVGYATIMSYNAPDDKSRGYVVKTIDGGEHWEPSTVTRDPSWIPYGINFVSEDHGWVGGSTGGYETRDGGRTWQRAQMGLSTNKIRFTQRPDGTRQVFAIGQEIYKLSLPASVDQ